MVRGAGGPLMSTPIQINGATRLIGIIGDPIVQVKSPAVYSQLFAERGLNVVMIPLHVFWDSIDAVVAGLDGIANLDALIVTAPYKTHLLRMADTLGPAAACVGAVNALKKGSDGEWHGDLFDGAGFVAGVRKKGYALSGRRVHMFGAGGAGGAIAHALALAGVQSIRLSDPHLKRVADVCAAIGRTLPGFDIAPKGENDAPYDFVINASTVGLGGGAGLPGELGSLSSEVLVGEVNMTAAGTELVRLAQARGCQWVDGRDMHAGQIDQLLAFLFPA
jgi:shikimate dehydrogenase